jgi:hypothetical protein
MDQLLALVVINRPGGKYLSGPNTLAYLQEHLGRRRKVLQFFYVRNKLKCLSVVGLLGLV